MNNLKRIRNMKKLSIEKLGEYSGISKAQIHAIEHGTQRPRLETAYKISTVLNVSVYDIWPNTLQSEEEVIKVRRIKEV